MAERVRALGAVALVVGAVLVVAGCDGDSVAGQATTVTPPGTTSAATTSGKSDRVIWDPCTIPDSEIAGLGLDTSSKKDTVAGVDFTGWKVCGWRSNAKTYDLAVLTAEHTLDEIRQRSDYTGFSSTTIHSRAALQYRNTGAVADLVCYLTFEVPYGVATFKVQNRYGVPGAAEPCGEVRRLTEVMAGYLPGS